LVRSGKVFLQNVPAPVVDPKNVLVRVERSCVSVGTEMAGIKMSALPLYRRALKQPHHVKKALQMMKDQGFSRVYKTIRGKLDAGLPTGYSAAGTVVAIGSEVDGIRVGDRVACAGAGIANHAEMIDVPVNLTVPLPDELSFDHAATVTLGAIAMQGVRRTQPTLGETVVVIGLGILGQITAQLLTSNGCRVIGTDVDQSRIDVAIENGMDIGLNASENIVEKIIKLTDGIGADAVIITAASPSSDIIAQAFQACRRKARVVIVGDVGLNLARSDIYVKELDVLISTSYGPGRYDATYEEGGADYPIAYVRWTENRNMAEYLRQLASGRVKLDNMLREPWPIEKAEEAYASLSGGAKPLLVLLAYPERAEAAETSIRIASAAPKVTSGRIGLALIGAGGFAQGMHLPNLQKLTDSYELRSVVSRTGLSARTAAERHGAANASTDFTSVLTDPGIDLVLIATRHDLHADMTVAALEAGKNVFVEKPLSMTPEGLAKIEEFYRQNPNGPLLMTGFNRRFSPAIKAAKKAMTGRTSPMIVNYRMNAGYIPSDHWVHGAQGGGRNIGEACHIYDLFNALTESQPVEVHASSIVPGSKHWRGDDNFVATVRYADGSVCTLVYTSMGSKSYAKETADIFVDGKVLSLDDYKSLTVTGGSGGWKGVTMEKGQLEELKELAVALKTGGAWPISFEDQVAATQISFEVERQIAL
jgi:predicted dehydrogenase/threonine dehydrogenase-like Zn-dependent dehydrogenase